MMKITPTKSFKPFFPFVILSCLSVGANAQTIFFNNGASVFASSGAVVQVNGGLQNDGASAVLENNGTITVANSGTPGTVFLTNGSTMQGNGQYFVEQDWSNSATFNAGTSTVTLDGDLQQFISTTNGTVTTFNNLTLTGTGVGNDRKKTLQSVNANVGATGVLSINDRELETLTNTFFVLNPATTAVTNSTVVGSEGFVSSSVGGSLSRATNTTSMYRFPTGSSVGTTRYRAVQLTPATAAANVFNARLGNNNATVDGFSIAALDTTICNVLSLFYHQINRTSGTDNAGIDVFYDQAADNGLWDALAQFNTPTAAIWNNMGAVTNTSAVPFNDVLKVNWSDFSNSPYILARVKPAMPVLACTDVCANSQGNTFTATGTGTTFTWTGPAGTTIASGQGTNSVDVDWGSTSGPLTVTTTSAAGCASNPATCSVTANVTPVASFDTISSGFTYNFSDLSTGTITSWAWDFGDGSTSSSPNPSHTYSGNGLQTVCLTVSNNGCADSICRTVTIDATDFINIPNVFTPDGDGINDLFYIDNAGLTEYRLDIFNRWGVKVFQSESAGEKWDGRSTSGELLSDGTYFYILKAISVTKKDYSTKGYIQLIRKN
jgi:gliding motility-associated-like protein